MTLHIHRYVELSAPLKVVRDLLAESPPLGAVRLGDYWSWLDELWRFEVHSFDDGRTLWHGVCPTLPEASVLATAKLADAGIATHLQLHVALELPEHGILGPWTRHRHRQGLGTLVDTTLADYQRRFREHLPASQPGDRSNFSLQEQMDALRTTHPVTVAAFEAMDALPSLSAVAELD